MIDLTKPIRLETSRAWRTYLGGHMIDKLHGENKEDTHFPEEWLLSAVRARNSGREDIVEGLCYVYGTDVSLSELLAQNPEEVLGEKHIRKHRNNMGVLLKLLDAGERLTLQVHPTKERAGELFQSEFGKTECWHIVETREINGEKPCIYMGFREHVTRALWEKCFKEQNIPEMLDCLHKIEVQKGDTYIIRGGVPHGIGAGCFLVEVQEPTDYTVRTERTTPSGLAVSDFMCHQGLGFEKMFECFTYQGLSFEETLKQYKVEPVTEKYDGYTIKQVIYPEITDMFALNLISVEKQVVLPKNDVFYGIYILSGNGTINGETLNKCDHYLIPASCEDVVIKGNLTFVQCFGPTS